MKNWEYKYLVFKIEAGKTISDVIRLDQLNALGAQGWELVSAMPLGPAYLTYTFKRPADEAPTAQRAPAQRTSAAASGTRTAARGRVRPLEIDANPPSRPQTQAQPRQEQDAGIDVMDILNSILGGGNNKN